MTNKETRKRKPGGGRKPSGPIHGKISNFSTRITAETRAVLEAEAAESGLSISQVAEQFLKLAIKTRRDRAQKDPVRALSYLLAGIAEQCSFIGADDKLHEWNTDPFAFEAFRLAAEKLLQRLRLVWFDAASIEIPAPKEIDGFPSERTAEQHGEYALATVWKAVQTSKAASISDIQDRQRAAGLRPLPDVAAGAAARGLYVLDDVRRDLKIKLLETKS